MYIIEEMCLKVGCFADFCHHHVSAMSMHAHMYSYPLL